MSDLFGNHIVGFPKRRLNMDFLEKKNQKGKRKKKQVRQMVCIGIMVYVSVTNCNKTKS